jgi:hypothetical protein
VLDPALAIRMEDCGREAAPAPVLVHASLPCRSMRREPSLAHPPPPRRHCLDAAGRPTRLL